MTSKRIAVVGATGRVGRHVVDVLTERGHGVVPVSRANGVDVITGAGLHEALDGVDAIVDVATGPSPEEQPATEFFTTAARNLQAAGAPLVVAASILGVEHFHGGYGAAKLAHERALLAGPSPARILRAAQFHEFVEQMMEWGRRGDTFVVPRMRTQLVAARTVAEALAGLGAAARRRHADRGGQRPGRRPRLRERRAAPGAGHDARRPDVHRVAHVRAIARRGMTHPRDDRGGAPALLGRQIRLEWTRGR